MDSLLAWARAVHIGSCLVLSSFFLMPLLLGRTHSEKAARLVAAGVFCAFASGFVWLWLAIAGMNGSGAREELQSGLFWMVLSQTAPGRVWGMRAGLGCLLALHLKRARRGSRWSRGWLALLAGAFTASLALLGHAGAVGNNILLVSDLVHLVAAIVWPAGLVPFVVLLRALLKSGAVSEACRVTRRFSNVSVAAVAALSLSGLSNSWFLVGSFSRLFDTTYGKLLLVKLALFAIMLALGAANRSQIAASPVSAEALRRVVRNVWLEVIAGSAILLVVGFMGAARPADYPG